MNIVVLSGKDIRRKVENYRKERQRIANKISWSRDSTPEEIKTYKQIKHLIVAGYTHDEIFEIAGHALTSPDRKFIDQLLSSLNYEKLFA